MTEEPDRDDLEDRVVGAFRAYAAGQSELGREFARRMRLHTSDSAALVEILRSEQRGQPLTPARLAGRIGLSSGATSILLNRLEEVGHITRTRGHADRRVVTLHSSPEVHLTSEAFFAPLRDELATIMARYGPDQLELVEAVVAEFSRATEAYARTEAEPTP